MRALLEGDEGCRLFIKNSNEAIFCVEFDRDIYIDMPEDEQIDLFFKHGYIAVTNDAYALSVGFEHAEDIVGTRIETFAPPSEPTNNAAVRSIILARPNVSGFESIESYKDGITRVYLNNTVKSIAEELNSQG